MADELKIIGPDGRPIQPPSKDNPVMPMLPGAVTVAVINQLKDGRFGIKRMRNIHPYDMAKVLCNLAASILAVELKKMPEGQVKPLSYEIARDLANLAGLVIQEDQNDQALPKMQLSEEVKE